VVLRSYDTRLRPTSRSPHVYLHAKVKETYDEVLEEEPIQSDLPTLGRPLLYLANGTAASNVRNFGDTSDIQQIAEMQQDWLWDNYGKLQLIETAFRKSRQQNVHEAQRPGDFIPIINHLLHLHEQGFVHGDIRAFNMVFDGNDGKLIDFDLSGVVGKARYPLGYKSTLPDGIRCGHALNLIEKHHDWYALGKVIFVYHEFQEPDKLVEEDNNFFTYKRRTEMSERFNKLKAGEGSSKDSISSLVAKLKDLLEHLDFSGWTCKASMGLYYYYHENNVHGDDPATGSPKIVKN